MGLDTAIDSFYTHFVPKESPTRTNKIDSKFSSQLDIGADAFALKEELLQQHLQSAMVEQLDTAEEVESEEESEAGTENESEEEKIEQEAPMFTLLTTYLGYLILITFGHVRDFFGKIFRSGEYAYLREQNGYAPLNADFENFYTRRLYSRIRDIFNRPITGVAGRHINLIERVPLDRHKSTWKYTGNTRECLNMSSYNYLGFADSTGQCVDAVEETVKKWGVGIATSRCEAGTLDIHHELESLVARFVGVESAMVVNMGFATNSTTIPALVGKGCLIISDELNHSSIVFGARLSGAVTRVYKHNNMEELELVLRDAIAHGQPRTHRPWKKILVIVEGLYSMEGSMVRLPDIVELKKKYKFFLYVDEAHSIGALGPNGRGICELKGVDPRDIDIMMGTFTKSFGAAGGYVAGKKSIIDFLRLKSLSTLYAEPISPPVIQQVISSMRIILGDDGTTLGRDKIAQLRDNASFLMIELKRMGFIVYGDKGSPIVPVLLFNPAKIPAFSRECLERGIAVVTVGYPATPIISSRVRFCCSAAHTRKDYEYLLEQVSEIGDRLGLKVSQRKWIGW